MKKYVFLLSAMAVVTFVHAQIPNNDFENWSVLQGEKNADWDFVEGGFPKTTDKHTGNFALKLIGEISSFDTVPGVALMGFSEDGVSFQGGRPFAAKPDSFSFWCKYSIAAGDTAQVYLQLKKAGIPLSAKWYGIVGSSSNFKKLSFKIDYTGAGTPDSIIIGFVSSNFMRSVNHNSYLIIDDIKFQGTNTNISDPGFENWTTKTVLTLDGWDKSYSSFDLLANKPVTVLQTTDKATGYYALLVQNVVNAKDTFSGQTRTGENSWGGVASFPVTGKPDTLFGLYKWIPENNDTFSINIYFYQNGSYIGSGSTYRNVAQNSYAIFKIPINYFNGTVVPDSATIQIYSAYGRARGNSKLYVDNLNFNKVFGVGNKAFWKLQFKVIPNPAQSQIQVQLPYQVENSKAFLLGMDGKVVKEFNISGKEPVLDIASIAAGNYLFRIEGFSGAIKLQKK